MSNGLGHQCGEGTVGCMCCACLCQLQFAVACAVVEIMQPVVIPGAVIVAPRLLWKEASW